jgi:SAM-dependent methyltransferase
MKSSPKQLNLLGHDVLAGEFNPAAARSSLRHIAEALGSGISPADGVFDRALPRELRAVSDQYWTPLDVAVRAAKWLDQLGVRNVVDIGAGAGKFCVAAALAGHAHFTGVEQRSHLVGAARDLACLFEVSDRVSFVHGAFAEIPVIEADAYYLYNPFEENLFGPEDHLDEQVELNAARYHRDIAAVEQMLRTAAVGTYLLTYNGFGGRIPASYREVLVDREVLNVLRMWRKTRSANSGPLQSADAP